MTQAANLAALGTNAGTTGILPAAGGGTAGTAGVTGFKNRIINGAMVLDQRNSGAQVSPAVNNTYYLDRWNTGVVPSGSYKIQQNAGSVTPPAGFTNYIGATSLTTASLGATDNVNIRQRIEGYNIADLGWGTANAKTVTLSFWVYSSLTGTFSCALSNASLNYAYPISYSIPTANTWTQISLTIPGATSGTWATDNTTGMYVFFSMGAGSSLSGTSGSWSANDYRSATGSTSILSATGATFYLTGVQLEVGSTATNFDVRSYGTELLLCQRYFEVYVSGGNNTGIMTMVTGSSTSGRGTYIQKVQKRANPGSVTFAAASSYLYQGAGLNSAPSAISVAVSSPSAVLVDVTISGATVNAAANLLENAAAGTNMILISAEL